MLTKEQLEEIRELNNKAWRRSYEDFARAARNEYIPALLATIAELEEERDKWKKWAEQSVQFNSSGDNNTSINNVGTIAINRTKSISCPK